MLQGSGTTGGDHRDGNRICNGSCKFNIIPGLGSVTVHAGKKDLTCAKFFHLLCPFKSINTGIQSSAIVVQGLANNSLKEGNILPQILKESVVSLINASIISLVVFIYNFFMLGDRGITASVSLSLFAVVMFASVFGTLVPMTLDKLKIDPALATGPFITITNDIIGMMIYMFITSALAG